MTAQRLRLVGVASRTALAALRWRRVKLLYRAGRIARQAMDQTRGNR
jgi:hypothetical protein